MQSAFGVVFSFRQCMESTYVLVPLVNVRLKTLSWTVRLIRQILEARLGSTESVLAKGDQGFEVVGG